MTKLAQLKKVYDELAKKQLKVGFLNTRSIPMARPLPILRLFKNWVTPQVAFLPVRFFARRCVIKKQRMVS